MKAILQRVSSASVSINGSDVGSIDAGILLFLGVTHTDTTAQVDKLIEKVRNLRMFADREGKTNLSITDTQGELLVVSQFTLYGETKKGNRPSFTAAASAVLADALYEYFLAQAQDKFKKVACGVFGTDMQVRLVNDGPFTLEVVVD